MSYLSDACIAVGDDTENPRALTPYQVKAIYETHLKEKDELLREAPLFMRHAYECRASRKLTKLDRRLLPEQLAQSLTCTCGLDALLSRINSHVKPH